MRLGRARPQRLLRERRHEGHQPEDIPGEERRAGCSLEPESGRRETVVAGIVGRDRARHRAQEDRRSLGPGQVVGSRRVVGATGIGHEEEGTGSAAEAADRGFRRAGRGRRELRRGEASCTGPEEEGSCTGQAVVGSHMAAVAEEDSLRRRRSTRVPT